MDLSFVHEAVSLGKSLKQCCHIQGYQRLEFAYTERQI